MVTQVNDIAITYDNTRVVQVIQAANKLAVVDFRTNTTLNELALTNPTRVCRRTDGLFWCINNSNKITQISLSPTGILSKTGKELILVGCDDVDCSPDGTKLLITTTATYQAHTYATNTLQRIETIGATGGFTTNAAYADNKLGFLPNSAVAAFDVNGVWLVERANYMIKHFNATKVMDKLVEWQEGFYTLGVLPTANDIFIHYRRYQIDRTKDRTEQGFSRLTHNFTYLASNYTTGFCQNQYPVVLSDGQLYAISRHNSGAYNIVKITDTAYTSVYSNSYNFSMYKNGVIYYGYETRPDLGGTIYLCKRLITFLNGAITVGPEIVKFRKVRTSLTDANAGLGGEKLGDGYLVNSDGNGSNPIFDTQGYHLAHYREGVDEVYDWQTWWQTDRNYEGPFPLGPRFEIGNGTNNPGAGIVCPGEEFCIGSQKCEFYVWHNRGLK